MWADMADFLRPLVPNATAGSLGLMARLLRQAHHGFVFSQSGFVIDFLNRCQAVDSDLLDRAISNFFGSAISGMRSGTPGEPMPRDLEDVDRSERILSRLSRIDPAFRLYRGIRDSAQRNIDESRREAEMLRLSPENTDTPFALGTLF